MFYLEKSFRCEIYPLSYDIDIILPLQLWNQMEIVQFMTKYCSEMKH